MKVFLVSTKLGMLWLVSRKGLGRMKLFASMLHDEKLEEDVEVATGEVVECGRIKGWID